MHADELPVHPGTLTLDAVTPKWHDRAWPAQCPDHLARAADVRLPGTPGLAETVAGYQVVSAVWKCGCRFEARVCAEPCERCNEKLSRWTQALI